MKYKGFIITPTYLVGSSFRETANGNLVDRNPTSKDIEYYEIYAADDPESQFGAELSIKECKLWINHVNKAVKRGVALIG